MAALESQLHEAPEILNLPPPATPSSPLDNDNERHIPLLVPSHGEFYAPAQHRNHAQSQASLQQPLIQPRNNRNPFNDTDTASIAPSVATTTSPPAYTTSSSNNPATRYGHRNEEEYLAALRAWAAEKEYAQLDKNGGLHGFYGNEELKDRADRMTRERKAEKEMKARLKAQRRGTVAGEGGAQVTGGGAGGGTGGGRRRGSVANFFRRQSNAV